VLGKTGQTNQVMASTIDSELQEFKQNWVKVHVSSQGRSNRDMSTKHLLVTLYLGVLLKSFPLFCFLKKILAGTTLSPKSKSMVVWWQDCAQVYVPKLALANF
jgi:hypothetical protein